MISSAKRAAKNRGLIGDEIAVVTLSRSLVEPFLTYLENRELREKRGGCGPEEANWMLQKIIFQLRVEQA